MHELRLALHMWCWKPDAGGKLKHILAASSVDWYRMLSMQASGSALNSISERWWLEEGKAREAISEVWKGQLVPKPRLLQWLTVHRALPTLERREDWMGDMGTAGCSKCPNASHNTLAHILFICLSAAEIWEATQNLMDATLGFKGQLDQQFVVLQIASSIAQRKLRKQSWWRAWRGWVMHGLWLDWVASLYILNENCFFYHANSLQGVVPGHTGLPCSLGYAPD